MNHPFVDGLMIGLSLVALPALLLGLLVARRAGRPGAGEILASALVALALASIVQAVLDRPRPMARRSVLPAPATGSYPSGHAAVAFAAAVSASLAGRRLRPEWLAGALAVSYSRLHLGHHFASDVLAGGVLGAAAAAVCHGALRRSARWFVWGQLGTVLLATHAAHLGLLDLAVLRLPGADKVLHFLLFGALAGLAVGWFAARPATGVVASVALLAAADEALQALSPARSFDPGDLAATLGGVVALGAVAARLRRPISASPAPGSDT